MKKLIMFLLVHISPNAIFSQVPDTTQPLRQFDISPNGIAHSRIGFVVIEKGKRPVYLDCQKKALKLPMVGWDFREVGVNEKLK